MNFFAARQMASVASDGVPSIIAADNVYHKLFWTMEDRTGSAIHDQTVNGNDGTESGGITYPTSPLGESAKGDSVDANIDSNSSCLDMGINSTNARTFMFWVRPTVVDAYTSYMTTTVANVGNNIWYFGASSSGGLFLDTGGGGGETVGSLLTANTWYHIALVYDGTDGASSRYHWYVNGTHYGIDTSFGTGTPTTTSGSSMRTHNNYYSSAFFNDEIEWLHIHNINLTEAQVQEVYDYELGLAA